MVFPIQKIMDPIAQIQMAARLASVIAAEFWRFVKVELPLV
jgi:hypothetical protein